MSLEERRQHHDTHLRLVEEEAKTPEYRELSDRKRKIFIDALTVLRTHREKFPRPPEYVAKEEAAWRAFAYKFLRIDERPLTPYVKKPGTFSAEEYCVSVVATAVPGSFEPTATYGNREGSISEPLSRRHMFMDAPLGIVLLHRAPRVGIDGSREWRAWEPLGVIGLTPDFSHDVLLVDQLQGGDTDGTTLSDEAKEARKAFRKSVTHALYAFVRDFAQDAGMRGIGLRDPARVQYHQVWQAAKKGKSTRYSEVARTHEMRRFTKGEYFLEVFKD